MIIIRIIVIINFHIDNLISFTQIPVAGPAPWSCIILDQLLLFRKFMENE